MAMLSGGSIGGVKILKTALEVLGIQCSKVFPLLETAKDKGLAGEVSSLTKKKGRTVAITAEDMQKRKNDVKARTTLLLAFLDKHQLRFSKYDSAKELLQAIVSHPEFMDVPIKQDDLNKKLLTSLAPEWLMYTIVWRNRDDLNTMSLDDMYNHLKVYEPEVQKKAGSNSQNIAFISSSNTSSGKSKVPTVQGASTASAQVPTVSTDIDDDNIEEMDIKWNLALLSMRADSFWKKTESADHQGVKTEGRERKSYKKDPKVEEPVPKVMTTIDAKNKVWLPTVRPKIPTASSKVPTAKPTVVADKEIKGKAVKALARWIWKPKQNSSSHGSNFNGVSVTFKKYQYIDTQGRLKSDSGCSRHMTGNISYLSEYEPFNGGYVSFGHERGKITGKSSIKTGKLEFKNVYFMEELKYNLFSVSQIYDNKNSVLFTDTKCLVLRKDFKLVDDKHVLLRTPRQQNMYTIDLKNIVPHKNLSCLIAKASVDEIMLWHKRLGHLNFKTMNKLIRSNLVKGFPSKSFENDHSCVACLKGKQHKASFFVVGASSTNSSGIKEDVHQSMKEKESHLRFTALPNWFHEAQMETLNATALKDDAIPVNNAPQQEQQKVNKDKEVPESSGNLNPTASIKVSINDSFELASTSTVETVVPTVSTHVPTDSLSAPLVTSSVPRIISRGGSSFPEPLSLGNAMSFENRLEDFFRYTSNAVRLNEVEADLSNMETHIQVSPTPTLKIHKEHPKSQIIGPVDTRVQTKQKTKNVDEQSFIATIYQKANPDFLHHCLFSCFLSQEEPKKIVLKNKKDKRGIIIRNKARLVAQGYTQEEGIDYEEVFSPVAKIEAIRLFLAYASYMGFTVYQMDVKSAFLYGTIDEEVYVMQPPGFQDLEFPHRVYKVEKAMYGLHQALRAWYGTFSKYLLDNGFQRGKDGTGKDVELHLYRSMIGSLMYLTASRPDIMFAVCVCARHQVTPKECHLHAVKRIFRYLKGNPKLGLWYPKESPFDLVAYSDSDYSGANQDRKSTTRDDNVVDLLTKAFDVGRFQYLVGGDSGNSANGSNRDPVVSMCLNFLHGSDSEQRTHEFMHIYLASASVYVWIGVEITDGETKVLDKVNGRKRTISESSIRRHLKLNDEEDETTFPTGDVRYGDAFPTDTSLDVGQDRENISNTSALPHEALPRVTSLGGGKGSVSPVVATASKSFPTVVIFTNASVATPTTRVTRSSRGVVIGSSSLISANILTISKKDKGKGKMTKPKQPSKEKVLEQMSVQPARDLEAKFAQEDQIIREQTERDSKIARIHADKELEMMIIKIDKSNEMVAKYLSEYEQAEAGLSHDVKVELINKLLMYQRHLTQIKKYQAQQNKPATKTEKEMSTSVSTWEDLTTRFLAQFFPSGRTVKLHNNILMFQQHQRESLSEAWTCFKDLLQKVSHHGIDQMFKLLKELTTSRASEKVLIREEAKYLVTKNVNSISLTRGKEEKNDEDNVMTGIAKYVLVDVARYVYPVDFMILDIREDEKMPIILGTPFLTTAKVVIKFDKGSITLQFGKSKISFDRIPESLGKVEKGIKNDIEPIAPTMTVNRLVLEWEERIKLHQEKEMEFDQWRSKNIKNNDPALVKVKGEINDGEVMFLALGCDLEEIHVTWAHLEKKRTRLRTYTKSLEESCSQSGNNLLTGTRGSDLYTISLKESSSSTPIYFMAKASPTQACLWHRRLSHLNFNTINLLSKNDIVNCLPKLKYVKDQLCSSCEMGKAKRSTFKTKTILRSKGRLQLHHMDLCGPMQDESINGKKYVMVIVDDYSRYTWTHFLRSKDETSKVHINFLKMIQQGLQV
uniref:Putative reverse transcriptase, RNA-dependent DNA polymerase n=1 Tax=Tanacetum cinerariifolium TaxID=118510 RepID=A0A6L2KFV8_TANCI|nr:putative reverse transcriptase, RNA-dependent DNA polymerase [Tanacetum cinerariifolium]